MSESSCQPGICCMSTSSSQQGVVVDQLQGNTCRQVVVDVLATAIVDLLLKERMRVRGEH